MRGIINGQVGVGSTSQSHKVPTTLDVKGWGCLKLISDFLLGKRDHNFIVPFVV